MCLLDQKFYLRTATALFICTKPEDRACSDTRVNVIHKEWLAVVLEDFFPARARRRSSKT